MPHSELTALVRLTEAAGGSGSYFLLIRSLSLKTKKERFIMRKLFNDEAGFIVSAELVLVLTIA